MYRLLVTYCRMFVYIGHRMLFGKVLVKKYLHGSWGVLLICKHNWTKTMFYPDILKP